MVIIMLGDVVGQSGCEAVRALLPGLRRDYRADAVIVNGEIRRRETEFSLLRKASVRLGRQRYYNREPCVPAPGNLRSA